MKNKRFVPYEKLSKKKKKELDRQKRQTWGDFDPTTRLIICKKISDKIAFFSLLVI